MSDAWRSYRSSPNVQMPRADLGRAQWLDALAYAPDEYRASHGLSPLTEQTRSAAFKTIADESPYIDASRDFYDQGRPVQIPNFEELPKLGQQSFMQRNDAAVLANQVNGMLSGAPTQPQPSDALTALFGPSLPFLGRR